MSRPIRILLLDDHSAARAGVGAIVAPEPDLELVAAAGSGQELWPLGAIIAWLEPIGTTH